MHIQWYPGHMTKTRRMIAEQIKNVDAVCEILDARIPISSRNPDVDELTAGKPRLVVLNRVDQADPAGTARWNAYFRGRGYAVLESDAKSGTGTAKFSAAVRELLADKLRTYAQRGMTGRVVRVMILGIPNVGKSTFINKVAGRKTAKTEDRPGVTRSKQWVPIDKNLELLDTPGILWPKFDDQSVWHEPCLHRRGEGRHSGRGDAGLPPDGLSGRALPGRAAGGLQAARPAGA